MNKKDINFLLADKRNKKLDRNTGKKLLLLLPPLLLVAIIAGVWVLKSTEIKYLQSQLDAKTAQRDSLYSEYYETMELRNYLNDIEAQVSELSLQMVLDSAVPRPDKELFATIASCAAGIFSVTDYSYDEADQTMTLSAESDSVNNVPKFIENLMASEEFLDIIYYGYTSDNSGKYYCTVACQLISPQEVNVNEAD